ncbi:Cation channel sperm-associated protein 1 [Allomyces javanicus]|nr:Cation channel sperm-associated protein 1 [Allomyces javanicus]
MGSLRSASRLTGLGDLADVPSSTASTSKSGWRTPKNAGPRSTHSNRSSLTDADATSLASRTVASGTTGALSQLHLLANLAESHWIRRQCFLLCSSSTFNNAILALIVLNTVLLAVQTTTYINTNYGWYLSLLDQSFLGIYLMETLVKLFVFRLAYFKVGWNIFDFSIVLSSILSFLLPVLLNAAVSFNPKVIRLLRVFRAFRAIRSLRALRAISFLKSLQVLVEALLASIPAMSSILALIALALYVFAVIARVIYAKLDPHHFGSLPRSMFWLFSLMTLDDWSKIWIENKDAAPDIFAFLFAFLFLESFVFLNLFVAVIVSNLDESSKRMERIRKRDVRAAAAARAADRALPTPSSDDDPPPIGNDRMADIDTTSSIDVDLASTVRHALALEAAENGLATYYPTMVLPGQQRAALATYLMHLAALEATGAAFDAHVEVVGWLLDLLPVPPEAGGPIFEAPT